VVGCYASVSLLTAVIIVVFLFVCAVLGITVLYTLMSLFAYGIFTGYDNAGLFLRRAVVVGNYVHSTN
jgi:4-hydroxybenzoate polyprenyltransferase